MPLYEYQCDACSHRFERIQKFSDPPADVCPSCGGPVRKLLSSPAIQFKGSGFYITDYPKKSSGSPDSGKGAGAPASSSGDTSSTTPSSGSSGGSSGSGGSGSSGGGTSSSS